MSVFLNRWKVSCITNGRLVNCIVRNKMYRYSFSFYRICKCTTFGTNIIDSHSHPMTQRNCKHNKHKLKGIRKFRHISFMWNFRVFLYIDWSPHLVGVNTNVSKVCVRLWALIYNGHQSMMQLPIWGLKPREH